MISAEEFLLQYDEPVCGTALQLRKIILANLPAVIEQVDLPAKMIAYCYGQKYVEMICTIIPSKKGIKLGFYKGNELPDPDKMLEGNGKISRHVVIMPGEKINSAAIKKLLLSGLAAYRHRMK